MTPVASFASQISASQGIPQSPVYLSLYLDRHKALIQRVFGHFQNQGHGIDWQRLSLCIAEKNQGFTFLPQELFQCCIGKDYPVFPHPFSLDELRQLNLAPAEACQSTQNVMDQWLFQSVRETFHEQRYQTEGFGVFWQYVSSKIKEKSFHQFGMLPEACQRRYMDQLKLSQKSEIVDQQTASCLYLVTLLYIVMGMYQPDRVRDAIFQVKGITLSSSAIDTFYQSRSQKPIGPLILAQLNECAVKGEKVLTAKIIQLISQMNFASPSTLPTPSHQWTDSESELLIRAHREQVLRGATIIDWARVARAVFAETIGTFSPTPEECQRHFEQTLVPNHHTLIPSVDIETIQALYLQYSQHGEGALQRMQNDMFNLKRQTYSFQALQSCIGSLSSNLGKHTPQDPQSLIQRLRFWDSASPLSLEESVKPRCDGGDDSLSLSSEDLEQLKEFFDSDEGQINEPSLDLSQEEMERLMNDPTFQEEDQKDLPRETTASDSKSTGSKNESCQKRNDTLAQAMNEYDQGALSRFTGSKFKVIADRCNELDPGGDYSSKKCSFRARQYLKEGQFPRVSKEDENFIYHLGLLSFVNRKISWRGLSDEIMKIQNVTYSPNALKNCFNKMRDKMKLNLSQNMYDRDQLEFERLKLSRDEIIMKLTFA